MTTPSAALGFFIVEASALIDGLDTLLNSPGADGPDAEAFVRLSRALRGNSTMYRQTEISRVASAVERAARALRERAILWNPRLGAALVATVDDLRLLVRNVGAWSSADDERASRRAAELEGLVPVDAGTPARNAAGMGRAFLATQTSELAAALERMAANPNDRPALTALLRHSRSLRGIALLKEQPVLAEVVSHIERVAQAAEQSNSASTPERSELFRGAATLLAHAASEISAGRTVAGSSPEADAFTRAAGAIPRSEPVVAEIVPVSALAFDGDSAHVISAASSPAFSLASRFRSEIVGFAEHLRRVIADARDTLNSSASQRNGDEVRAALRGLIATAQSFSETEIAQRLSSLLSSASTLSSESLSSLDIAAKALADPHSSREVLLSALEPETGLDNGARASSGLPEPGMPQSPAAGGARRQASATPTGAGLREQLRHGISEIGRLDQEPLNPRIELANEAVVPIETLVYSGRAALLRAVELRNEMRRDRSSSADRELTELFDLIDLALAVP
ncbi:MAG: hypothetical protein H7Z74_17650 [Anaerolineae bacterium]|nr:hypothetical protein [Gemmatimonadaceae bacterium]